MTQKKKEAITKKVFQTPAILDVGSPTKDGGIRLKIETNEIAAEDIAFLMKEFNGRFGWFLFSANKIENDLIPEKDADAEGRRIKTPSQRLRAVLYLWYQQINDKSKTFDQFYVEQMEKVINKVKEKLDD